MLMGIKYVLYQRGIWLGKCFFLKNKVAGALPCIEVGERK